MTGIMKMWPTVCYISRIYCPLFLWEVLILKQLWPANSVKGGHKNGLNSTLHILCRFSKLKANYLLICVITVITISIGREWRKLHTLYSTVQTGRKAPKEET